MKNLRPYTFITYILTATLTIPFAILYISLFAGLLKLIGLTTSFLLGARGIGFFLLAIWGGYRTAKYIFRGRWNKMRWGKDFIEHDKVKKKDKPITKESVIHESRLEDP